MQFCLILYGIASYYDFPINYHLIMKLLKLLIILIAFFTVSGCSGNQEQQGRKKPVKKSVSVVSSIPVFGEFTEKIVDKYLDLDVLISESSDPQNFKVVPKKMSSIDPNAIILISGLFPFEKSFIDGLNPSFDRSRIISLDMSARYSDVPKQNYPWLSPNIVQDQIENITEILVAKYPEYGSNYLKKEEQYSNEIKQLNLLISKKLDDLKTHNVIDFTNYFGYFIYTYSLDEPISNEEKNRLLQDASKLLDAIKSHNIGLIFVPLKFSSSLHSTFQQGTGVKIISINPLAKNYIGILEQMAKSLE